MSELAWGRRFLLCPPDHFEVRYAINPWMADDSTVDPDRARVQWDSLAAALRDAGAEIELLEPVAGLPDLVFTANAGLVDGRRFVPARFHHPQRRGETPHATAWFERAGYDVAELPAGISQEGAGDALPFGGALVAAHGPRSHPSSPGHLATLTGAAVRGVGLVDERLYHLDLTFCPLDERRAIVAPDGWDAAGRRAVEELVAEPLVLDRDDAYRFCANSVVVGRTVVMPSCPPAVGRRLERWGFEVVVVDVGEFRKAGGACRCLTLALDVRLSPEQPAG